MRSSMARIAGVLLALTLCAIPSPARAGASFDFLFSMDRVSNDNQYFLNVAVSNYGYNRVALQPVLPRLRYVEVDLPVVLFLAHECGRPPAAIVDLRASGLSWSVIFTRVGVSPAVLFEGIDRDPGPPYGNAWGHWRKHPREVRLSDRDISGLVQVQIGARAARATPYELAYASGRGRTVAVEVAERRGRPYHAHKKDREDDQGEDGKHKGHGPKGHGPHD